MGVRPVATFALMLGLVLIVACESQISPPAPPSTATPWVLPARAPAFTPELTDREKWLQNCAVRWREGYCDELAVRLLEAEREGDRSTAMRACDYSGTTSAVIKGNIGFESGERIYHVPGGEFYATTVINERYGERWFCTEAEALQAGWRRSLR